MRSRGGDSSSFSPFTYVYLQMSNTTRNSRRMRINNSDLDREGILL